MINRASLRIWLSLSLMAVAAAAALTSWNLLRVMSGFQNAGGSGLLSVGRGIIEANQRAIVGLYFGIACVLVAVVTYVRAPDYTPPAWLILSVSALALIPLVIVWIAETLMLEALPSAQEGVVANATLIERLLFVAFRGGVVISLLYLFSWALRVSPTIAPKRTTAALSLLVGSFVLAAIAFHLRNAWINGLYTNF